MTSFNVAQISEGQAKKLTPSLFAVRRQGKLFVYRDECPHLGIGLAYSDDDYLDRDGAHIICSTHGALFEIANGECIFGPCQGDSLIAVAFHWLDEHTIELL